MTFQIPAHALGPKMLALSNDRMRLFVWWMANGAPSATAAARAAGYSDTAEGAKVRGCLLMQMPSVIEALNEAASKTMKSLAPLAITKAKRILENESHPGHARMIETILDRSGHAAKSEHKLTVEHTVDTSELEALARRLAAENGIDVRRLLGGPPADKVIEGEVVDAEPS